MAGRIVKALDKAIGKKIAKANVKKDAVASARAFKAGSPGKMGAASAAAQKLGKTQSAAKAAGVKPKSVMKVTKKAVALAKSDKPRSVKKANKASKGSKLDFTPHESVTKGNDAIRKFNNTFK
jgi:hypothetical protein